MLHRCRFILLLEAYAVQEEEVVDVKLFLPFCEASFAAYNDIAYQTWRRLLLSVSLLCSNVEIRIYKFAVKCLSASIFHI